MTKQPTLTALAGASGRLSVRDLDRLIDALARLGVEFLFVGGVNGGRRSPATARLMPLEAPPCRWRSTSRPPRPRLQPFVDDAEDPLVSYAVG